MTREEALEVMWKNLPSDKSLPVYEALQTLIPELRPKFKAGDIIEHTERKWEPGYFIVSVDEKGYNLKDGGFIGFGVQDEYTLVGRFNPNPTDMDKECIGICKLLNSLPTIQTFESCSGHLKDRFSVWFFCDSIEVLSRLGRAVEHNYSDGKWEVVVDSTDTHPYGVFWLRSKSPFQNYEEMNESLQSLIANIRHWFKEEFDSYFIKPEDTAPVRLEEEDGEKYPVVDYKLMGRKPAKLSVEDKQLVLKDLSARVPYKVNFQNENIPTPNIATLDMTYLRMFEIREGVIFKPYLRPRSSMTEAEKDEEFKMCSLNCSEREMVDFFNKHHLDYNGLIEKGLAIEAPEGMYKKENLIMANSPQLNEQKPVDLSEMMVHKEPSIAPVPTPMVADEQKPDEIDEEINRWMGCEAFPEGINITPLPQAMEIVERTAKHFFELGEKTVPSPGGYWEGFKDGVRECQAKLQDVKGAMKEHKPINQCNTHEPSLDEARKWNEAYEKGYSLGYKNGKNEQKPVELSEDEKGKNTQIALKGWVARDKSGEISLYRLEPNRSTKADVWDALLCDTLLIDRTVFPDLTWEDEPLKVVVQLVKDE